jgi:hypothetical protein
MLRVSVSNCNVLIHNSTVFAVRAAVSVREVVKELNLRSGYTPSPRGWSLKTKGLLTWSLNPLDLGSGSLNLLGLTLLNPNVISKILYLHIVYLTKMLKSRVRTQRNC